LKIKRDHVGAGFPRPITSITEPGRGKPAPTLDCVVALNFQGPSTHGSRRNSILSRQRRLNLPGRLNVVANSTVADATGKLPSRSYRALKRTAKFKTPLRGGRMRKSRTCLSGNMKSDDGWQI
jgi:hypothetical protein